MKRLMYLIVLIILSIEFNIISFADEIVDIEELFLEGNYTASIVKAQGFIKREPTSFKKRQAYYLMGLSFLKLANTEKARECFKEAINYKLDSITINSNIGIADSYFIDKKFYEAINKYKDILELHPRLSNKSNIYFKLGQCYLKLGSWQQAKDYFYKVKRSYPLSFESYMADEILNEDAFYFTVQVGSFTNYSNAMKLYQDLKRKDYPVFIDEKKIRDIKFYRVRVGKFDQKFPVYEAEKELKKMGLPTKIYP